MPAHRYFKPNNHDVTEKVGEVLLDNQNNFMEYSFTKGLGKGVIAFILFALPLLTQFLPNDILNLTVGGLLTIAFNYIKFKYQKA